MQFGQCRWGWIAWLAVLGVGCSLDTEPGTAPLSARDGGIDRDAGMRERPDASSAKPPVEMPGCKGECALGAACKQDADCAFRACEHKLCVAPRNGPKPTGAVTKRLDAAGGTLTVVTDERVQVELVVPPDALRTAITLTWTPQRPETGSWLELKSSLGGLLFRTPAALTITLPPDVTFGADAWLSANGRTERVPLVPAEPGASVLQLQLAALGNVARVASAAPTVAQVLGVDEWSTMTVQLAQLSGDDARADLELIVDDLLASGRIEDAAALRPAFGWLATNAAAQADADSAAFLMKSEERLCSAYMDALAEVDLAAGPHCVGAARTLAERVGGLARTLDALGSECPQRGEWPSLLSASLGGVGEYVDDPANRSDWLACECMASKPDQRPRACDALGSSGGAAGTAVFTAGISAAAFDRLAAVEAGDEAAPLARELQLPVLLAAREVAFEQCKARGDMSYLALLAGLADESMASEIRAEAQRCASALSLTASDGTGARVDSVTIAPLAAAGNAPQPAATVHALRGGKIALAGPIATLLCRAAPDADAQLLDDVLAVEAGLEGSAQRVRLGTRAAAGSRTLLDAVSGFDIDVDDTLQALGLGASDALDFHLFVTRATPSSCSGAYAASSELFDVHLVAPAQ